MDLGRGWPIGLAALAVGLCVVVGLEISGRPQANSAAIPGRQAAGERVAPVAMPDGPDQHEAWLKAILSRPLFNPDRRPVLDGGVRGLPRLAGIIVAGSQRMAIFAGPSNGHPIVAQAGAHVGAYEVRTVSDSGVTVVGPEGITTIRPAFDATRQFAPEPRPGNPPPVKPTGK